VSCRMPWRTAAAAAVATCDGDVTATGRDRIQ